jgi:hypothetical protein
MANDIECLNQENRLEVCNTKHTLECSDECTLKHVTAFVSPFIWR